MPTQMMLIITRNRNPIIVKKIIIIKQPNAHLQNKVRVSFFIIIIIGDAKKALTCRNAALSVSLSASIQNCSNAVVCCNRAVHVTTWSLSARTRISLSCLMHSTSWDCLVRIASIRASHCADTTASNSSQFSCKVNFKRLINAKIYYELDELQLNYFRKMHALKYVDKVRRAGAKCSAQSCRYKLNVYDKFRSFGVVNCGFL